ncbi:hypothetical protein WICPIJ_005669 [Wickerhamomyces pijperi]|uniref:K Homology domain-containing protein n=1 Tax=Wickerhamomyces pijperi TaxID=599730 RepID=A0A9P8TM44_WICPI|nr:hypothetical protein WICPIJ_005669 [Wickerhamomyces pijperi]
MNYKNEGLDLILSVIPLKYTYILKPKSSQFLYESNSGLWNDLMSENSQVPQDEHENYQIIDCLRSVKSHAIDLNASLEINITSNDFQEQHIQLTFFNSSTAQWNDISRAQSQILKGLNQFEVKQVDLEQFNKSKRLISSTTGSLDEELQSKLDQLAKFCNVEIIISDKILNFNYHPATSFTNAGSGRDLSLYILGSTDDTIFAEMRIRMLLDHEVGLFVESVELPLSLLPLLGGVEFGNFKSVAKEALVNIYLPTTLPELFKQDGKLGHDLNLIFLSGSEIQVLLAKKQISDMIRDILDELYFKEISVLQFKKDYIVANYKNELSSIMYKYGVFIQLPAFGADECAVRFQGNSSEIIELAIQDFIGLTNNVYLGNIWFHKEDFGDGNHGNSGSFKASDLRFSGDAELKAEIQQIVYLSQTSIHANKSTNSYEMIGTKEEILTCFENFQYSCDKFGTDKVSMSLKIELGLIHHEFISGKKNGKISKIMNNSPTTKIQFEKSNEYNMIIELRSGAFTDLFNSFNELQLEFPSEIKFHIPEAFHRQIIGTGGSIIQTIMRKYNVFVKFSNSYDLKSNFKNHVRFENVIIRCPFKNSSNIPLVQHELEQLLVTNEAKHYTNTFVRISVGQYNLLDFNKIQEIEKKSSTYIKFPKLFEPYLKFKEIEILGIDNNSITASKALLENFPESYEFQITWNAQFNSVFNDTNQDYLTKLKVPIKVLYNYELFTVDNANKASHSIIISYHKPNESHLGKVIKELTAFLRAYDFMIFDRVELSTTDSIINGSASSNVKPAGINLGSSGKVLFSNIQSGSYTNNFLSQQYYQQQQLRSQTFLNGSGGNSHEAVQSSRKTHIRGRPSTFNYGTF